MSEIEIPKYHEFHWPAVVALRELGGSATIEELNDKVIADGGFTEAQQSVLHKDGPSTEIEYRLAWARTYLKGMGLAINSERGVWSLTDDGRVVAESQLEPLRKTYLSAYRNKRKSDSSDESPLPSTDGEREEITWQDELLDEVMKLSPGAFERLAQRLLREAGFVNTQVTGRSGDGGIDGQGVYRLSLLSFPVFFQCKRYVGSVGAGAVRDFRGAMAGRGEKGLLITTGTFTAEAKNESTRDGAPPLDLIDGKRLCHLLKEYKLGVSVSTRMVEDVTVLPGFFAEHFG
ncbi:restriction endonuclease [Kocuria salsicia]|uniref:Restriction endonuclease n=1 Tax=Kocuria salsicia TaxID=664639 RepID=A0ABV3KAY4_9MICC